MGISTFAISDRTTARLTAIRDRAGAMRGDKARRLTDTLSEIIAEREDDDARDAYWDARIDEARGR